ncbi:MAG: serine hydrolase domain-containing protein [Gemmatimonadales bacterium]|nr:serine hydrolase domain-containing protein [Gemmatimonadales bacterium]MDZ4390706.1 serine hydrolase domain-containing protein [Gemmatimonadales bacterium]
MRIRSELTLLTILALLLVSPGALAAQRFAALDSAVRAGVSSGTFPGAVVVVGRSDTILHAAGYGHYTWSRGSPVPNPTTSLWDIASLSKVVATTSAIAVLVDRGLLDLDAPVAAYLPDFFGSGKDKVTVRMLLDHTSGLPAWSSLSVPGVTPQIAMRRLLAVELQREPGRSANYSDINAMLAALVVERAAGQPLERFAQEVVFGPFGMQATLFRPAPADQLRAVPTERRRDGSSLVGVVQDPNARALGGIAGNAGVFSTGTDLAQFAQRWLRVLRDGDSSWVHPATASGFLVRTPISGTRALGWDTPTSPTDGLPPLYGACATETTIGHTGWTGTLLWIDPAANLFVIMLTNRSYAPRTGSKSFDDIRLVRAAVSDAARRAVVGSC